MMNNTNDLNPRATVSVTPTKTVALEHRIWLLERFPNRSLFAAASREGIISLFDLSAGGTDIVPRVVPVNFATIQSLSPHPTEPRLALIADAALVVVDLDGNRMFQNADSEVGDTGEEGGAGIFVACAYDPNPDEPYVWSVVRKSPETVDIQPRDRENGTLLQHHELECPYSDSYCSLHPNSPHPGMALWLAAGQDGQQIYWLNRSQDGIMCREEPDLEDTTPPVFSPSGDEFLTLSAGSLQRYTYPPGELLGSCSSPWEEAEFGSFCYLPDERVLAGTSEGCLFILDVPGEGPMDDTIDETDLPEVIVEGHEPQPLSFYYPPLSDDSSLCTDITGFTRFGDVILAQFRRREEESEKGSPESWKDTLLCLPLMVAVV